MAQSSVSVFGILVLLFVVILPAIAYGLYILFKKGDNFEDLISKNREIILNQRKETERAHLTLQTELSNDKENDNNEYTYVDVKYKSYSSHARDLRSNEKIVSNTSNKKITSNTSIIKKKIKDANHKKEENKPKEITEDVDNSNLPFVISYN